MIVTIEMKKVENLKINKKKRNERSNVLYNSFPIKIK